MCITILFLLFLGGGGLKKWGSPPPPQQNKNKISRTVTRAQGSGLVRAQVATWFEDLRHYGR